jgi:putative cardiolipin synthase
LIIGRRIRRLRAWPLLLIALLAACAAPPRQAQVEDEYALPRSANRFWQHVGEARDGDWFKLLNTGEEAYRWRLAMIDSAHQSIDLESFLWKPDTGGLRILSHLLAAADRGVRVRILLDDAFTAHEDLALHRLDLHPGIEVRIYNPYHNRSPNMAGRMLFNLGDFGRVNHRMHNKTLIVDGWAADIGGRNLANEYFGLHAEHNFRDMEVLVMGDSAALVSSHFDAFWNSGWAFPVAQIIDMPDDTGGLAALRESAAATVGPPAIHSEAALEALWKSAASDAVSGRARFFGDQPARTDPAADSDAPNQLAAYIEQVIAVAEEEVILVSAYLVPTPELSRALTEAVQRGVRVVILTNSMRSNNHLSAYAAYSGYIRGLLEAGVELFELRADASDRNLYMETPVDTKLLGLHAKFMLVDSQRVFIGSSNLDPRSLNLNTEVGLMIESQVLNERLRRMIAVDFEPRNAWSLQLVDGDVIWVGGDRTLRHSPADSVFQQLENWFMGLMPIDSQM